MQQPKVKQFDFNESQIFGKFDLYCKRVQKLIDMFQTIDQFRSLSQHQVEGMENLIEKFFKIADDFKKKPYDLLDFTKNVFDFEFREFNVNVAKLETELQGFINASFSYNAVMQTITGYSDVLWTNDQANMHAMTEQVNGFQANCKKLPKVLRDWDSCKELTKRIDDFFLVLQLLQQLAGKSMRQRHWDEIQSITGKTLDMDATVLKLGHMLAMDLLAHAEEVEDICTASSKELQIETKLRALIRATTVT